MDGDDERRAKTPGNEPSERSALADGADAAKPAAAMVASLSNWRRLNFRSGLLGFIPNSNDVIGRIQKRRRFRGSHIDLSAHTIAISCKTESTVAVDAASPVCQTESFQRECESLQRESEAPAELAPHWFGRSLTLPSNELVGQSRCDHVYRGDLTLPNLESIV